MNGKIDSNYQTVRVNRFKNNKTEICHQCDFYLKLKYFALFYSNSNYGCIWLNSFVIDVRFLIDRFRLFLSIYFKNGEWIYAFLCTHTSCICMRVSISFLFFLLLLVNRLAKFLLHLNKLLLLRYKRKK